jgi:hypothetical protein
MERFESARDDKLRQISSQIDVIGEDGVQQFLQAVSSFCERWALRLPEETMSSAIDIVEAFENEDMSDLRYRIPESNGGFLKEEDMSEEELAELRRLQAEKEEN